MPRDPFAHHQISPARLLELRFGRLSTVVEPQGVSYASGETGILGNGCSVESPRAEHDDDRILWGHVDRLLLLVTPEQRHVLSLAYGDAGAIVADNVSEDGTHRYAGRLWRAVVALTPMAKAQGELWIRRQKKPRGQGPVAERWVEYMSKRYSDKTRTPEQAGQWEHAEQQARKMLSEAEEAFRAACRESRAA